MPFTASHPALVLPLVRRAPWVTAALVTGSIAPDLPSYLPLGLNHYNTHTRWSWGWPDSLLGVGLLLVWWVLLRPGLAPLWPAAARRCGPAGWRAPLSSRRRRVIGPWLVWVALSELLGIVSHLAWDSFTHAGGFAVVHWPVLASRVSGHAVYDWLQVIFSVVGLAIVAGYLLIQWQRQSRPTARVAADANDAPDATDGTDGTDGTESSVPARTVPPTVRAAVVGAMVLLTLSTAAVAWHLSDHVNYSRLAVSAQVLKDAGGALLLSASAWSAIWAFIRLSGLSRRSPHSTEAARVP